MYSDKHGHLIPYRLSSLYALAYCEAKRKLTPEHTDQRCRNSGMLWEYVDKLLKVVGSRKETMPALHPDHDDRQWNQLAKHLGVCISIVTASAVSGSNRRVLTYYGIEHTEAGRMCIFYDARNQCYHVCTDETMFLEERSTCLYCGEQLSRRDNLHRHEGTCSGHREFAESGEVGMKSHLLRKFRPIRFRPPPSLADKVDELGEMLNQKYLQYARKHMLNKHLATFDVSYITQVLLF